MKSIILDTESNGMRPEQICQLSYIIANDGQLYGRNFFFSVTSMNEYAQMKHGFSKMRLYQLSGGHDFNYFANEIMADLDDADLVCGHNIEADVRVLSMCYFAAGCAWPKIKEFCTMRHFDNCIRAKNKHGKHKLPRLEELYRYYGINDERIQQFCTEMFGKSAFRAHDARFDAAATCLCILKAQEHGDVRGVI